METQTINMFQRVFYF